MHPIEHLRYLARADSADAAGLVAETATALGALRGDSASLVVAARRIIERHPSVGPLWWLCAHLLVSDDPRERAWALADEVAGDPTGTTLTAELPLGGAVLTVGFEPVVAEGCSDRPDIGLTCLAVSESGRRAVRRAVRFGLAIETLERLDGPALAAAVEAADVVLIALAAGSTDMALVAPEAAAAARAARGAGVQVWLVAPVGTCLPRRYVEAIADAAPASVVELELAAVDRVLGPSGARPDVAAALAPTAPMAPELLRAVGAH